jgi:2'-5' RNA ligase
MYINRRADPKISKTPMSRKFAVVGYPNLDEVDRRWIELFRSKHDPQASRIGAHYTLAFPVEIPFRGLESEIAAVAQSSQPISFIIRHAEVVRDAFSDASLIFLIPDEGNVGLTALHDHLYAGVLRPYRRLDIPFVPHVTIGAAPDPRSAQKLVPELNFHSRIIRGTVDKIDLVEICDEGVRSLAAYALGRAPGRTGRKIG